MKLSSLFLRLVHHQLPTSLSFNDTATTEIYTLSLHDALPISSRCCATPPRRSSTSATACTCSTGATRPWRPLRTSTSPRGRPRSEEHTFELQSRRDLVCRLLLEKKKQ